LFDILHEIGKNSHKKRKINKRGDKRNKGNFSLQQLVLKNVKGLNKYAHEFFGYKS
jgi:hypothetical protein